VDSYEKLRRTVEQRDNERWQELSGAFLGGCGVFFVAFAALRIARTMRSQRITAYRRLEQSYETPRARIDEENGEEAALVLE
jgi:hypothetical protein